MLMKVQRSAYDNDDLRNSRSEGSVKLQHA
jgi:hypothetical protein